MIKESFIYNGYVIHKRFKPKEHFFKYKVFSLFIDLHEIHEIENYILLVPSSEPLGPPGGPNVGITIWSNSIGFQN